MVDESHLDVNIDESETVSATTETKAKPAKTSRSKRDVLNSAGAIQDEWIGAQGFAYTSLAEEFTLTVMLADLSDEVVSALATFGGLTLAGNVTNTVRNGKEKGTGTTETAALTAWLDNLKAGNWTTERGEVEASVTTLATAYARALAKQGKIVSIEDVEAKLKAADKDKRAAVRKDAKVLAELRAIASEAASAKAAASTDDIVEL